MLSLRSVFRLSSTVPSASTTCKGPGMLLSEQSAAVAWASHKTSSTFLPVMYPCCGIALEKRCSCQQERIDYKLLAALTGELAPAWYEGRCTGSVQHSVLSAYAWIPFVSSSTASHLDITQRYPRHVEAQCSILIIKITRVKSACMHGGLQRHTSRPRTDPRSDP